MAYWDGVSVALLTGRKGLSHNTTDHFTKTRDTHTQKMPHAHKWMKMSAFKRCSWCLYGLTIDTYTANSYAISEYAQYFRGFCDKTNLKRLEQNGDCSPSQSMKFHLCVGKFDTTAVNYITKFSLSGKVLLHVKFINFPLSDEVLLHAKFINFEKRQDCHYSDFEYLMARYKEVFSFSSSQSNEFFMSL